MKIIDKLKPTTFLILGVLLMIFSIIMFFYSLSLPGGGSMAGFGFLIYFGISLIMIIVDRFLVNFFKVKLLSIYEIIFLVIAFLGLLLYAHLNQ
jgi:Na+/melibiose symporter-like transporter